MALVAPKISPRPTFTSINHKSSLAKIAKGSAQNSDGTQASLDHSTIAV